MKVRVNEINKTKIINNSELIKQVYEGIYEIKSNGYSCKPNYETKKAIDEVINNLIDEYKYPEYNIELIDEETGKIYNIEIKSKNNSFARELEINENKILRRKSKKYNRLTVGDVLDVEALLKELEKDFNKNVEQAEIEIQKEVEKYIKANFQDEINEKVIKILEIQKVFNNLEDIEAKKLFLKNLGFKEIEKLGFRKEEKVGNHTEGITYHIDWNKKEIFLGGFSTDD